MFVPVLLCLVAVVSPQEDEGEENGVEGTDEPDLGMVDVKLYLNKNLSLLDYSRDKILDPDVCDCRLCVATHRAYTGLPIPRESHLFKLLSHCRY